MPFELREFMVKTWKRHRDVPTTIDQLVDRAVEDLERRRLDLTFRMRKNRIKVEPLVKVENLLQCCFEVAANLPDDTGSRIQQLKEKLKTMKQDEERVDARLCNTQMRFLTLRTKGRLGNGSTATANWELALREASNVEVELRKSGYFLQNPTEPEMIIADMVLSSDAEMTPVGTLPPMSDIQDVGEESQTKDEWVECVKCSKWRLLPRGLSAATLQDEWNCSDGDTWRTTGLSCDVVEDVEENASNDNDTLLDLSNCHQPLVGAFMVRLACVDLMREEETWLLLESGLRPCYTWKDGYSLYRRCAAANRGTTKQQLLSELLKFWGYKWQNDSEDETRGPYENIQYQYVHDYGTEHESVTVQEFTQEIAQKNVEALRMVQDTLIRGTSDRLNKRYNPPSYFWKH